MTNLEKAILLNVGATEISTFGEVLRGIGDDAPGNGPTTWAEFFRAIKRLESAGYLVVDRNSKDRIDSFILTESGSAEARKLLNNA